MVSIEPNQRSLIPDTAQGEDREQLIKALDEATSAAFETKRLTTEALDARRRATRLARRYEELVAEFNGQLTIYDALGEESP